MSLFSRLANAVRGDRLSRSLDVELDTHLAELTDELVARGMPREDAIAEARRRFGNRGKQKEAAHDADTAVWLESVFADIRYALRTLRSAPAFTLVAVCSLALGIGANTAIFSLIDAVALRSLPVTRPWELSLIDQGKGLKPDYTFTNPLWEQIRARDSLFGAVFAYSSASFNLSTQGIEQPTAASTVSGDFFRGLGVQPVAGRLISAADDLPGCPLVTVLGDAFARARFGSAAAAVGKAIPIEGHPAVVIGVADPRFTGLEVGQRTDLYAPLCAEPILTGDPKVLTRRSRWYLKVMVRTRAGESLARTDATLHAIAPAVFQATVPGDWDKGGQQDYLKGTLSARSAAGGASGLRDNFETALEILMAVVGAVLLIACANIGALLSARAASRQREVAIRLAIGASHRRLIRQLLTESLTLAAAGAVLGVVFSHWATRLLVTMLSTSDRPVVIDLSTNQRVLAFAVVITVVAGVGFGLLPAWRASQTDPQSAMKSGGAVRSDRRRRLGHVLVGGQVAISLLLVACAGLLVGSFQRLMTADVGFTRDGIVLASLDFGNTGWKGERLVTEPVAILDRIRMLPGMSNAAMSWTTPVGHAGWNDLVHIPGYSPQHIDDSLAWFNQVSPGYFATMGTRLLTGRDVNDADIASHHNVVVINTTMAKKMFGTLSPLGRTYRTPDGDSLSVPWEVIGVIEDTKYAKVTEEPRAQGYYPMGVGNNNTSSYTYEIRTSRPMTEVTREVSRVAAEANPQIALQLNWLSQQINDSLARPRLLALLSGFFGLLALLLAMMGLYGTMSYNVAQRRGEIGIRIALGAGGQRVLGMVVGEASWIILGGVAGGLALVFAGTRLLGSFLYGVTATDPITLGGSVLLLAFTGLLASVVPAWRAARVDPVDALREQ
ncbi:MAG TPA: ABC transporter permease [Gemmatimonadales bacterium]|jgi:predicted permease